MTSVMPDAGVSVLRVLGALIFVLALFFGGVWLARHRRRLFGDRGPGPKLQILETRSLGNRQALYVVEYERQRMLLATSSTGVTMLSQLPRVPDDEVRTESVAGATSFSVALDKILRRK